MAIRCCVTCSGIGVGSTGSWEAVHGAVGESGVARGSVGTAWMAWTVVIRFWTCATSELNWSTPTTVACDGGETPASIGRGGSFAWLPAMLSIGREAAVLV